MPNRFVITEPVRAGYAWYDIHDTRNPRQLNLVVATVEQSTPDAKIVAQTICDHFNCQSITKN